MIRSFAQGTIALTVVTLIVASLLSLLSALVTARELTTMSSFDYRFGPAEALPPAVSLETKPKIILQEYPRPFFCQEWSSKCHDI